MAQTPPAAAAPEAGEEATRELSVMVGKSLAIDSTPVILRVSIAADIADAIVVSPHEVMINGKAPGTTSFVLWQEGGGRIFFNLTVRLNIEPTLKQLHENFPDAGLSLEFQNGNLFLRGKLKDPRATERALAIASTLGRVVNLLETDAPASEAQIMLRVRFADIDRAALSDLGVNLLSSGALNTIGTIGTGQFGGARRSTVGGSQAQDEPFIVQDLLNIFLFRQGLNVGATIRALQQKRLLQILAEPNLLTLNRTEASFLAGGEFPFPVVQGGAAAGAVTIQFREFGVRLTFQPVLTPQNTIRMRVRPEVSSLDYANAISISGFTVPAIATRKLDSEIELADGQSFVIGGLLDNRLIESFSKIPGLGDIPIIKSLFRSRSVNKNKTELMVMVTPELVRPYKEGEATPGPKMDQPFLDATPGKPIGNPRVKDAPPPAPGGSR